MNNYFTRKSKGISKILMICILISSVAFLYSCQDEYCEDSAFRACGINVREKDSVGGKRIVNINLKSIFDLNKIETVIYSDSRLSSYRYVLDKFDIIRIVLFTKSRVEFEVDDSNNRIRFYTADSGDLYNIFYDNGEQIGVYYIKGYIYVTTDTYTYVSTRQIKFSGLRK